MALAFCLNAKAQIITTVAGSGPALTNPGGYSGDGGQATAAELSIPEAVVFDAAGNLYIADWNNHVIRKVNTAGIITTVAGTVTHGFSGDGGPATAAQLNGPSAVAFDAHNNLYIADYYNNRVRMVNTAGIITTLVGTGAQGFSGDGGQATTAQIYWPSGIDFDAAGNLFVLDYYNIRVRKVNTAGIISTVAGNGTSGYNGDGIQATTAKLNNPAGIMVDAVGNLFIADELNYRVRMVNTAGIITTFAGNGNYGTAANGVPATSVPLYPDGLTHDINGNIYISNYLDGTIRKVNAAGIIITVAGNDTTGFSGDGGNATAASLCQPSGLAFDATGNLFIADGCNNRIRGVTNVMQAGIQQLTNNNQLHVFPNPAQNNFTIETTSTDKQNLFVYDVNGKQVLAQTIQGTSNINASTLNAGVYYVSITNNYDVVNKRLVIVK